MKSSVVLLMVLCLALSGCRAIKPEYSLFKSESEERIDDLWRQGYGYNNPNAERTRNRGTPTNFDGSPNTSRSATKNIGERAIGNVLAFAIFEGVPAVFSGISKKLRRLAE